MTLPGPTIDALKAADRAARREGVPEDVDARLRFALRAAGRPAPAPRPRRWLAPAFGMAAAAAAMVIALWPAEDDVATVAGFEVPAHCDAVAAGSTLTLRGACGWRLDDLGVQLSTASGATVRQRPGGRTIVDAGDVTFDVDKRRPSQGPYEVQAQGAVIVVHGTRFIVEMRATPGSVSLEHGSIELRRPSDTPVMMKPGDREPLARVVTSMIEAGPGSTTNPSSNPPLTPSPSVGVAAAEADDRRASPSASAPSSAGTSSAGTSSAGTSSGEQAKPREAAARESKRGGSASATGGERSSKAPRGPQMVASATNVDGAQLLADVARLRAVGSYEEALSRVDELLSEPRLAPRSRRVGLYERMSLLGRLDEPITRRCAAIDAFLAEAEEADSRVARAQRERLRLGCR